MARTPAPCEESVINLLNNQLMIAKELLERNEESYWELAHYVADNAISKLAMEVGVKNGENIYNGTNTIDFLSLFVILTKWYPIIQKYKSNVIAQHKKRNFFQHDYDSLMYSIRKVDCEAYVQILESIFKDVGILAISIPVPRSNPQIETQIFPYDRQDIHDVYAVSVNIAVTESPDDNEYNLKLKINLFGIKEDELIDLGPSTDDLYSGNVNWKKPWNIQGGYINFDSSGFENCNRVFAIDMKFQFTNVHTQDIEEYSFIWIYDDEALYWFPEQQDVTIDDSFNSRIKAAGGVIASDIINAGNLLKELEEECLIFYKIKDLFWIIKT